MLRSFSGLLRRWTATSIDYRRSQRPFREQRTVMSLGDISITAKEDERRWNRFAVTMAQFHNYFKIEFTRLYELADGSFANQGMSIQMYLRAADSLKKHLEAHHTIEERFVFPELAKKMPSFAENEQHRKSHEGIHEGLTRLSRLTREFREDPTTYSPQRMRECFDSFKDVLMRHLDEEVEDLRGENLKKYWTLEELDRIAM